MITLQEIEKDLRTCYGGMQMSHIGTASYRHYARKAERIEAIKKVMQAMSPSQEYLVREHDRLAKRIKLLEEQRARITPGNLSGSELSKWRTEYNKLNGLPHLKDQLLNIQYMLQKTPLV